MFSVLVAPFVRFPKNLFWGERGRASVRKDFVVGLPRFELGTS
jgi:hypothetical protein